MYVERISATSTKEGYLVYDVQNIFQSGEWRSNSSHYPMDGIQINLLDPSSLSDDGPIRKGAIIESFQTDCPASSATQKIKIYINGAFFGQKDCNQRIHVKGYVSSIFIMGEAEKRLPVKNSFNVSGVDFFIKNSAGEVGKADVVYPEKVTGRVAATSVLEPASAFRPYFIFDGRIDFGWSEGAKNSGEGESLQINLERDLEIRGMEIYTGFQMSESHFEKNAVPVSLEVKSGDAVQNITLKPIMGSQRIFFNTPFTGKSFTIKILSAKKGSVWQDALISEITLVGNENRRFTVADPEFEKNTLALHNSIKDSILSDFADQALFSGNSEDNYRILIRSNASFVIWHSSPNESIVMDGNWYPDVLEKNRAVIHIIGRLHKVESRPEGDNAEGNPYADSSRIVKVEGDYVFADTLEIGGSETDGFNITAKRINGTFSN